MSRSWPRSSTEAGWAVALLGLLLSAFSLTPARADAATSLDDQARQVLAEGGYQLELPRAEAQPAGPRAHREGWPAGPSASPGGRPPSSPSSSPPQHPAPPRPTPALAAQTRFLGLLLGGVALVVLILVVLAVLAGRRHRHQGFVFVPAEGAAGATESAAAEPSAPRGDADRLAAEGRWVEALQALLHGVQQRLAERHRRTIPVSCTSREVFRELPSSGAPREAQAELVALVERALFAKVVVGGEDYRRGLELARGALGSGERS